MKYLKGFYNNPILFPSIINYINPIEYTENNIEIRISSGHVSIVYDVPSYQVGHQIFPKSKSSYGFDYTLIKEGEHNIII